ncbi:interleukin-31 receptor subunit alpha isoform X2 [Lissotriton helveticus]
MKHICILLRAWVRAGEMLKVAVCILAVLCRSCLAGRPFVGHAQIKPLSPVVERGSTITLSCVLDKSQLSYSNSSSVFWRLNNSSIPPTDYTAVNESVSNVTLHNFTSTSGYLSCLVHYASLSPQLLQQTEVTSGYRPEVPQNISCIYFHEKNFTCTWVPGRETELETKYLLVRRGPSSESICRSTINSCSFLYPDLHFNFDYKVWVKAENALAKTAAPEIVSVKPMPGLKQMLEVLWKRPLLAPNGLPVKCVLRYRSANSNESLASSEVNMSTVELGMFNLRGLHDYTEYAVAVRCICTEGQILWSDWSAEKTGRTEERAPSSKVDLWRAIDSGHPYGNRSVRLMWKELPLSSSGTTLGYRTQCFLESYAAQKLMGNTTENTITFNITGEAYWISVVAYNSAGDSPEASLRIPSIGEKGNQMLEDVETFIRNEQLVVSWKPSTVAVDGYVLEWCVDSDTDACDRSWQRLSNSTEWTFQEGIFEPLKCYNISVFPLFENQVGDPYSIQVYLVEGPPKYGPLAKIHNAGKHEVAVKWEEIPKNERHGFVTNYTIQYSASSGSQMTKTVSPEILEYTIKDLQSNTLYNVYITARTKGGETNGTSIQFRTLKYSKEDVIAIIVPVLFAVFIGVICLRKKQKLKQVCWPDVPNPAGSSMAEWSDDMSKVTPLLYIQPDGIVNDENINVLDSLCTDGNKTKVIEEYPRNFLESTSRQHNSHYWKEIDFAKPPSPLSYISAEKIYKSQLSSDAPGEQINVSGSCLIQGLPYEEDSIQYTAEEEICMEKAAFNPYLKNSVITREFIFPGNSSNQIGTGNNQQLMIIAPCPLKGIGEHYVTTDMVGLRVVH